MRAGLGDAPRGVVAPFAEARGSLRTVLVHELRACPCCGVADSRRVELGDGHVLSQCRRCETVFAPAYADPEEIYKPGYLQGGVGAFGLDIMHPLFQAYLLAVSRRRVEILRRNVPAAGEVLDVGCGSGEFLMVAREAGFGPHGFDPLPDAVRLASEERGLDVVVATLEEYGEPEPRFDVVTALHVLEHVPDVQGFLRRSAAWVRPGGHVLIEVPNYASRARRRRLANWSGLRPLEHVTHFTPDTLTRAFRRAGLTPVAIETPTYIGPPQELTSALTDLELASPLWRAVLGPTCTRETRDGLDVQVPRPATWAALRAVERFHALRRAGVVIVGIARVGG